MGIIFLILFTIELCLQEHGRRFGLEDSLGG